MSIKTLAILVTAVLCVACGNADQASTIECGSKTNAGMVDDHTEKIFRNYNPDGTKDSNPKQTCEQVTGSECTCSNIK